MRKTQPTVYYVDPMKQNDGKTPQTAMSLSDLMNVTSGRYTRAEENTVGWLTNKTRKATCYKQLNSKEEVRDTPFSFCWDGTTLHVNSNWVS